MLAVAAVLNAVLLAIAALEFRRYRIEANLFSTRLVIALTVWTLAEAAVYKHGYAEFVYAALMGSIGLGALTDKAAGYVLDIVTLPICAFSIVATASSGVAFHSMIGAVAAAGGLFSLYAITRGQGLGLGDVKLAAACGTLLGAQAGLLSLGISFIFGGSAALPLLLSKRANRRTAVPFAPFMAAGALAVLATTLR